MRRIAVGAGDPRSARVCVPLARPRSGSLRPATREHRAGPAGGTVRHIENPHDAGEESSYHAPVYGADRPDVAA
jgi:hypothetical protein